MTAEEKLALALDKLNGIAGECSKCDGTGLHTVIGERRGVEYEREEDCEDCADIRDVIARCAL